ncbi:hypothetical protein [Methanochimaera problematica]|uniref:hypothetical protein n=1 Tax=Methanochimaera problematica TaxID=2609417 RepID=UPI0029394B12|nr:hypothetical protein [Methanoplanus sp. FWC-SCC4]
MDGWGVYDTVIMFETPDVKVAINLVLNVDRMDIGIVAAVPLDTKNPYEPV